LHGIDRVEKAIIENAERKASEIAGAAKRRAEEIRVAGDAEASALEGKALAEAEKQAALSRERAVADARMRAANELVNVKNAVFDAVFDDARASLAKWKKSKPGEYKKWVLRLVAGAARGKAGFEGVELVFARDDEKAFKGEKAFSKFKLVFSGDLSGGVIVRLPGANIEVDESFEQKIRGAKNACAVEVARILFGEKSRGVEGEKESGERGE
jgi:V/A-type H+-transporting ATPase subunit E